MLEVKLEFDQTAELDVSLDVLQYLGTADHEQLANRDAAAQHPISAIDGLEVKHEGYDQQLQQIGEAMNEIDTALNSDAETLEQYGEILTRHGNALNTQGQAIENHAEALETQAEQIEALTRFSRNIATTQNVQEVLEDA